MSTQAPARMRRYEELVPIACRSCGDKTMYSARRAREFARTDTAPLCRSCRFPLMIVVTDELLDWWTDRFSDEEIVDLAEEMWGSRERWHDDPPVLRRPV